jgi:hypothetical protein
MNGSAKNTWLYSGATAAPPQNSDRTHKGKNLIDLGPSPAVLLYTRAQTNKIHLILFRKDDAHPTGSPLATSSTRLEARGYYRGFAPTVPNPWEKTSDLARLRAYQQGSPSGDRPIWENLMETGIRARDARSILGDGF